ncbi:hypothetical protein [Nocardia anaemiae]|uniref:hypothetical protein n=1 Tax=Nocardia anaemiae TaxID=263910 RepID=UPI000B063317|nr:hypothetical protein [Nocardia anaemiae]
MTSNPDVYGSAATSGRIARIRIVAACLAAILMLAVSAAIVFLIRASDPLANGFTATDKVVLLTAAFSAAIFVFVGILLFRGRASIVGIRAAEAVLWLDFVVLGASAIALLVAGSFTVAVWIAAIGFGFDLAKQLRQYRPPNQRPRR